MITINNIFFNKNDFNNKINSISKLISFNKLKNNLIGICFQNPFDIICIINYAIKTNYSLLLIHPETPLDRAKELAIESGCFILFYDNFKNLIKIHNDFSLKEPGLFQFSSGTTGKPKLIHRSWDNIQLEIKNYNKSLNGDSCQKSIILVPSYHSYGLISGILSALERDVMPIIITEKNPKFISSIIISNSSDSIVYGVPFLFHLLQSIKSVKLKYNKIITSGASLSNQLYDDLKLNSDQVMIQYGTTETGCISLCKNPVYAKEIGKPLDHFTVVIDEDAGNTGEIIIKHNDKEIYTNDIGYFLENKSLVLLNRKDDLINVGGQKVIPIEVEEIIYRMDNIKEVVVYKTKHPVMGEAVKAMIVPYIKSNNIKKSIKEWCLDKLPSFKIPSYIEIVDEIPHNVLGKVIRKQLS